MKLNDIKNMVRYGTDSKCVKFIDFDNIKKHYHGGENWNSAYTGTWEEIVIPFKLTRYRIPTKNNAKDDINLFDKDAFELLIDDIVTVIGKKIVVSSNDLCLYNGKFCLVLSITDEG